MIWTLHYSDSGVWVGEGAHVRSVAFSFPKGSCCCFARDWDQDQLLAFWRQYVDWEPWPRCARPAGSSEVRCNWSTHIPCIEQIFGGNIPVFLESAWLVVLPEALHFRLRPASKIVRAGDLVLTHPAACPTWDGDPEELVFRVGKRSISGLMGIPGVYENHGGLECVISREHILAKVK